MSCQSCEQRETKRELANIYFLIALLAFVVIGVINYVTDDFVDIRKQIGRERSLRIELTDTVGFLREQFWASKTVDAPEEEIEVEVKKSHG